MAQIIDKSFQQQKHEVSRYSFGKNEVFSGSRIDLWLGSFAV